MMGLGWQELAIILVIVVIIFGAGKLPEIGSGLGKGIRGFKEEAGLDEDKKNEAIDKGSSKTASTLTASTKEARDEVVAGANKERREIRADEI
jgi:sec-independent protein translocase protein TatA